MLSPIPPLKDFCFNPTLNLKILFVPEYPRELRPLFPNLRNDALKNYNYKSKFCSFCFPFFLLKKENKNPNTSWEVLEKQRLKQLYCLGHTE